MPRGCFLPEQGGQAAASPHPPHGEAALANPFVPHEREPALVPVPPTLLGRGSERSHDSKATYQMWGEAEDKVPLGPPLQNRRLSVHKLREPRFLRHPARRVSPSLLRLLACVCVRVCARTRTVGEVGWSTPAMWWAAPLRVVELPLSTSNL